MRKLAVRLLMVSMLATLLVVPGITQVSAETGSTHVKKKKVRVVHQSPKANPSAKSYSNNPYEDDFDRRNAGGGGGY